MQHIELDERGVAWVTDTNRKVIEIVLDRLAWGWDADEIQRNHPDLPLAKIHAAFAYYYEHQAALDAQLAQDDAETVAMMAAAGESPLRKRLRLAHAHR